MRKHNSIFNQVCTFINVRPIGTVFTNDELFSSVDEPVTNWKRREKDLNYTTRFYRYWLMKAGVLEKFGKKTWKIVAHVPDHVESHHVWGQKRRTPYQLWHISHENKIKVNKPSDEEITIFIVMKRHVEPVNVFKTQVSALLSTGRYFEDEMDAWYFLSIGTGVPVESLKLEYNNVQSIAKNIVEITKKAEAEESLEIFEAVARLDGLLTIIEASVGINSKIIYKLIDFGSGNRVFAYRVPADEDCLNNMNENESLVDLLTKAAKEVEVDIEDIIDENIQLIESELADKALAKAKAQLSEETYNKMFKPEVKNIDKLITIEDLRGRTVYYNKHKEWVKGTILNFNFSAMEGEEPKYGTVRIKEDDTSWINYKDLYFSKEEVIAQFTQSLNSL
jgi:hypothetical protein